MKFRLRSQQCQDNTTQNTKFGSVLQLFANTDVCMCLCLIGIQQLQLILLKVALIVAVEFHINVEFVKLLEPPEDQENEGIRPHAQTKD